MHTRIWLIRSLLVLCLCLPALGFAGKSDLVVADFTSFPATGFSKPDYPFPAFVLHEDEIHEFSDEPYVWMLSSDLRGAKAGGDWQGLGFIEVWPSIDALESSPLDAPCLITQQLAAKSLATPPALTCPGCSVYHQAEALSYSTSGTCSPDAVSRLAASYRWRYQGYRDAATAGWPADLEDVQDVKAAGYRGVVYSTDLTVDEGGGFGRYYLVHLD